MHASRATIRPVSLPRARALKPLIDRSMAVSTSKRFVEGPLSKWTNVVNGWQYRWFVLDQNSGLLSYYTSKEKMKRGSRRGCIRLKRAIIGIDDEDDCTFTIRVDNRIFHFQAQNSEEREQWVHALEACIRRLHQPVQPLSLSLPDLQSGVSLDHRLSEAEGYYSLLQDQVREMSKSLNSSEEAKQLQETSKAMLEALRQCIDIMKDSQLTDQMSSPPMSGSPIEVQSPTSEAISPSVPPPPPPSSAPASTEVPLLPSEPDLVKVKPAALVTEQDAVSEDSSSGSSSDVDSDEFFDADNELEGRPWPANQIAEPPSMSIPVDEEDPEDVEEDPGLMETDDTSDGIAANKSVIMHMLSQVRVGMDLTRIVLPTFILEKRSLLEMYADFLAHPDIFSEIPNEKTPKDRLIAIVRYYLSAFHAARKGTVAKKPYNPILGEIFCCYWDLPCSTRTPPSDTAKKLVDSGPVSFASYNSVTFIAEQVSHHPPISGFYAECPHKNMYVTGSLWTKSKFLGLSLGVHNVGSVNLHLLDFNEVYSVTIPNAYGRSILTVPWLELGGKCELSCPQTGYGAVIDFHCKPFYGGKKHRVTAEMFHTNDKKPFMKVEGEWNGVMYIKHPNGDQEVFMDTINTPTIRKKLKKLSAQDPGESRRRWQFVTEALLNRDVEAATEAKHTLEEKQRADARERKETGTEWKQQLFHLEGDTWVYNDTLDKRLARLQHQGDAPQSEGGQ